MTVFKPITTLQSVLLLQIGLLERLMILLIGIHIFLPFSLAFSTKNGPIPYVMSAQSDNHIKPFHRSISISILCSVIKTFNLKDSHTVCFISLPKVTVLPAHQVIHHLPGLQNSSQFTFSLKMTNSNARFISNFMGFLVTIVHFLQVIFSLLEIISEVVQPVTILQRIFSGDFVSLHIPSYHHF